MADVLFPFASLIGTSQLALTDCKISTGAKDDKGEVIPHRIDVVALDTLKPYRIKCDMLDPSIASLDVEAIANSLRNRQYHFVILDGATAKPYAATGGYGVAYSIRAKNARIETAKKSTTTAPQGFPAPKA